MKVTETKLKGCFILTPKLFNDSRGFFYESYNESVINSILEIEVGFVQDNISKSTQGVIRALHYQTTNFAQAKLVQVLSGRVLDVAVDIRKDSPTYGQHIAVELSSENKKQLFIPRGFAHGFSVLSDTAVFFYKCDNYYDKDSERGIIYSDEDLNIDWGIPKDQILVSQKDAGLPSFKESRQ